MSGEAEKLPLTFRIPDKAPLAADATVASVGDRQWKLETVPEWWYENLPCCKLSKAAFMWWSNLVCAVFHSALAVATVIVSTANGRSFATPTLTVYVTNLTWVPNSKDALLPAFQRADTPLYLSTMTLFFFLLSALAHGLIVGFNFYQAFAYGVFTTIDDSTSIAARKQVGWTGWYYVWLHQCRQPLRWIEYSFSASLMIITIAVASGVTHTYSVASLFVLMWCTMCFGYYTEVISPPIDIGSNTRPTQWVVNGDNENMLLFPKYPNLAFLQRLAPHMLGYVPYITVWSILFHSFFSNAADGGGGPPDFVYIIVIGQMMVFTGFGITQLVNQIRTDGPSWYMWGEWSYLFLSLFSKGLLGMTLLYNVFLYETFAEAVAAA